jgi:hypothetical protein
MRCVPLQPVQVQDRLCRAHPPARTLAGSLRALEIEPALTRNNRNTEASMANEFPYFCMLGPNPFGPIETLYAYFKELDGLKDCEQVRMERRRILELVAMRETKD